MQHVTRFATKPKLLEQQHFDAILMAPFAALGIRTDTHYVTHIDFLPQTMAPLTPQDALAEKTCQQLMRYLDDPEFELDLPFQFQGTAFQQKVWRAICTIPPKKVKTYGELAKSLQTAPRALGGACGANLLPLIIPCHRVVASNGIGGFAKNDQGFYLNIKRWLLQHEAHPEYAI